MNIYVIAEYHSHFDYIHEGFLPTLRTKQRVSDEDSLRENFSVGLLTTQRAGKKKKGPHYIRHLTSKYTIVIKNPLFYVFHLFLFGQFFLCVRQIP